MKITVSEKNYDIVEFYHEVAKQLGYNANECEYDCRRINVAANIQDGFTLGIGNHTLGFLFTASAAAAASVKEKLEYKQIPPDITGEAKIYRVTVLKGDASESTELSASEGKILRIHGRNLSFNMEDAEQGVFLENENGLSRMENYARRGTNIVDFTVPASLAAGSYSISIVTKPGNKYFTANIDSEITVA